MSKKIYSAGKGTKRFGLFSVIALVAGIVIGSGIFQKNEQIIEGTGNQMTAIWAWVAGTILVLATVMAFIEIFSISNKAKKPGTLFYWSKNLIGPRTGKLIAIIAVFVYIGMSIAALPLWASNKMLGAAGLSVSTVGQWEYFFMNWGIGLIFLAVIYGIVIMSKSGQKSVSNVGMGIKLIPLFFVIISAFVFLGMGQGEPITGIPPTDPVTGLPAEGNYGDNAFLNILSVLPAILFTYNGFITSASMMNEAKTTNTYKAGYIGGMLLTAFIYIMFTLSTFWVGATGLEQAVKNVVGEENGAWVFAMMQSFVVVSMLSGMMGTAASGPRHYANMSADGLFKDEKGQLLKRNPEGVPQFAAWQLLGIALIYQFTFQGLDMIAIGTGVMPEDGYMMALNFATDFAAIFVFFAYSIVLAAGLVNRVTNKVDVDKSKLFIPSAIVAILGILMVMGFQLYDTIYGVIMDSNFVDITVLVILVASPFIILWWNERRTKDLTKEELKLKEKRTKMYDSLEVDSFFKDGAKPFAVRIPNENQK